MLPRTQGMCLSAWCLCVAWQVCVLAPSTSVLCSLLRSIASKKAREHPDMRAAYTSKIKTMGVNLDNALDPDEVRELVNWLVR